MAFKTTTVAQKAKWSAGAIAAGITEAFVWFMPPTTF